METTWNREHLNHVLESLTNAKYTCSGGWDAFIKNLKEMSKGAVMPTIKKVIFNPPATIVQWEDGTKSVVKCQNGEPFDMEKGFALAYLKKLLGNDNTFNKEVKKWCVGEVVAKPPKSKYYNGWIECVNNTRNERIYTTGKRYLVQDGVFIMDNGDKSSCLLPAFKSFNEWDNWSGSEWREVKD